MERHALETPQRIDSFYSMCTFHMENYFIIKIILCVGKQPHQIREEFSTWILCWKYKKFSQCGRSTWFNIFFPESVCRVYKSSADLIHKSSSWSRKWLELNRAAWYSIPVDRDSHRSSHRKTPRKKHSSLVEVVSSQLDSFLPLKWLSGICLSVANNIYSIFLSAM